MDKYKNIIKNTLICLKGKNLEATPDNYFCEFVNEAKKQGIQLEESKIFEEIVLSLNQDEKNELSSQSIRSFSQLSLFLQKQNSSKNQMLNKLSTSLTDILAPSVNYDVEEEIDAFALSIQKNPRKLLERSTIVAIKKITDKRIENDRKVVRNKTEDIIKLTSLMGKYFDRTLLSSENSTQDISNIKTELEDLHISDASVRELSVLQSKLIDTVYDIENSMQEYKVELLKKKESFNDLESTVIKLQEELMSVKEQSSIDYLTKVLNRRSFDKEIEKIEKKYSLFNSNYAIVFYDIDHFKKVNDTYGHDCGDAILRTFAGILKGLTRQEDVIARWGGEEFIVILNYDKEKEIIKYLKRVKEIVKARDFNYKNIKVDITYSAGVSFRHTHKTHFDVIKDADELLYQAKESGRDKIIIEIGTII